MKPKRVQMRRTKGWRKPPNTVCVGRPTVFGNPFTSRLCGKRYLEDGTDLQARAVQRYREWLGGTRHPRFNDQKPSADQIKGLTGKNLACWCPLDQPCHADVLLEIANR